MAEKNNKRLSLIFGITLILVAAVIITLNSWPQKKFAENLMYFSDDDGKTWYTDNNDVLPPYQHNGKTANGAIIYSYAKGSKQFCGFLFRFPPNVKKQIESNVPAGKTVHGIAYGTEIGSSREVKAPNSAGQWYAMGTPEAVAVTRCKAPDGSDLDQVLP